ncbi:UNVERIFIED_CONTAM: hypothetical protein PYX00_010289 [Menopon gallinae]|uniref:Alanine--glyoxylate aminotransferase n=1 Tax=Menopon gallinae TaxID=328185 RepID=A0AAW2HF22_9NEOP
MDVEKPKALLRPLVVTRKTMMGPGPSNCSPRVLHALSQPVIGHFHKETFEIMDEIKAGLQYVFQTNNEVTLAVSATGHGGMEAAMCNLVEPGDKVLVAVNGIWGRRAMDIAFRYGGAVEGVEVPPGRNFKIPELEEAIRRCRPAVFFIAQGESSTGVYQPVDGLGEICRKYGCLLVVDTVASLGGVQVFTDRWLIDCVYSGSQKVLGAPPGLAPISFNRRSLDKILSRKTPVSVFYFDVTLLGQYWNCFPGKPRIYHHTISATMLYGLREGLAEIVEEGIGHCIERHRTASEALHAGLKELGLDFFVPEPEARLPTVTTVLVKNMDWKKIIDYCLNRCHVEVSGGLGPTVGKVLRIGVMGRNADEKTVHFTLKTLKNALETCSSKL